MTKNRHGGNAAPVAERVGLEGCPDISLDFSVNLNPIGPPNALRRVLVSGHDSAECYPEEYAATACRELAFAHGLPPEQVVVGNGATEIFSWIVQALQPKRAVEIAPCYAGYSEVCHTHKVQCKPVVSLFSKDGFMLSEPPLLPDGTDMVFVGTPNNPTGTVVSCEVLLKLASDNPHCSVVVDASFAGFVDELSDDLPCMSEMPENMVIVKSLTKFFCIPGLRLGMAWGRESIMEKVKKARLPWSVNGLAQNLACSLYKDADYIQQSRKKTSLLRRRFESALSDLPGFSVYPSEVNFLLVHLPLEWPVEKLQKALLQRGVLIRSCADYDGLDGSYCRLAVRPEYEQDQLIQALKELCFRERPTTCPPKPRRAKDGSNIQHSTSNGRVDQTPSIMVVGTTSDAGKSVVAAGLCRLLSRRGFSVAPFKAQNMALNSFVTAEGGEMGRAQVTQAAAAGVRPHTDMNPVLLKPLGHNGSQVIVNGKAIGNFKAREYYAMKSDMRKAAHDAYDRLAAKHDFIVLEGAGSPAEINLLAEDFVNMDMAAYANAKTILVADIDRGGVFATIFGTIQLMPPEHRHLVVGVIINKFRGDASLLDSGIRDIEAMTGVPILGVLPYLKDLQIEEEDSMGLERSAEQKETVLDVVVIRLPHISNFTDFLAMEGDDGVHVRYVREVDDVGKPDLVIIPGTKNTRSDLQWLHNSGMSAALRQLRQDGIPFIGICGGFQMLGSAVQDPDGEEGIAGETEGLDMLPVTTTIKKFKELAQVEGVTTELFPFGKAGIPFSGYEIHAGETIFAGSKAAPLTITSRLGNDVHEQDGAVSEDGMVFGCYTHGFFDKTPIRAALWQWLCQRKGIEESLVSAVEMNSMIAFDRLADQLEECLDLDAAL